ncbi:MAG: hypothetical protein ACKV1O_14810 [Saprospiraceae bacterium]
MSEIIKMILEWIKAILIYKVPVWSVILVIILAILFGTGYIFQLRDNVVKLQKEYEKLSGKKPVEKLFDYSIPDELLVSPSKEAISVKIDKKDDPSEEVPVAWQEIPQELREKAKKYANELGLVIYDTSFEKEDDGESLPHIVYEIKMVSRIKPDDIWELDFIQQTDYPLEEVERLIKIEDIKNQNRELYDKILYKGFVA